MPAHLVTLVIARRRLVLVLAVLFLAVAAALGGPVASKLSGGGFTDDHSPSERASAALARQFDTGPSNVAVLVTTSGGVDASTAAGNAFTARLAQQPYVTDVVSYWSAGRPTELRSRDGRQALVVARVVGTADEQTTRGQAVADALDGSAPGGLRVQVGGQAVTFSEVGTTIEHDILRAESIAVPVTAVLLVLVFGSAVAAALPLLIGVLSILGTFLWLEVLHEFTDVSVYSVNLATSLGLGLGIDYALFMVTRFREELDRGRSVPDAVRETVRTAGRTIIFSATTVGLSLAALLVFPLYFLRSFAYAGIAAVVFALLGALVVLPAALAALGTRVDSLDLRVAVRRALRRGPQKVRTVEDGFWHRVAVTVMRRPVSLGTAVVVLLLVLGLPFKNVVFGLPDDRVLPRGAQAQEVGQVLRTAFPGRESYALPVVLPRAPGSAQVASYATALSRVSGVERVDAATGRYERGVRVAAGLPTWTANGGTHLSVVPSVESYGAPGESLVHHLRGLRAPAPALIGGQAASLVDTKASLAAKLPLAVGLVFAATFVLLFLFTGSVLIPAKALVLNVLSLTATFGAMVFVFQEGHLGGLIGNPVVTGTLDTTIPILMFCVLFGLSMDYEVFLLSRMKEEWDATHDNRRAVALGLERTGRLVTAAAALLALVFLSFVSSDITFIKLLGLGTALAVIVDATLIRGVLVPAFMRLAGDANWWAPAPLRRLHARVGLSEAAPARELVDA